MTIPSLDPLDPFESKVRDFLRTHRLLPEGSMAPRFREWGVAISGGGDSVLLAHLLNRLCPPSISMKLLHFNHHTNQQRNLEDIAFVKDFSARLGRSFLLGESSSQEKTRHGLSETILRKERHDFFNLLLEGHPHMGLFLAHQRDDRIETVLGNLFRGGGPRSLVGIAGESRGKFFRPLLEFGREEIRQVLKQSGIPFRDDPENQNTIHLRSRIRHGLREEIDRIFPPNGTGHLAHLADLMEREIQSHPFSPSLMCERELRGRVRFSLFLYHSLRPSTQGAFLRTIINRQMEQGLPPIPERNLLRTLESSDSRAHLRDFPLGSGWSISIEFGRTDLVYKYPESDKWFHRLEGKLSPERSRPLSIALPRGGSLLLQPIIPQERRDHMSEKAGMSVRIRLCGGVSPDAALSVRYWSPGLRVFPEGVDSSSSKTVATVWKNLPLSQARKAILPILCRGSYALWIPCILDKTDRLSNNEPGETIQLTFQERERSEWKKFLGNP